MSMRNIQDYMSQNQRALGGGSDDPMSQKKKQYLAILFGNIGLNVIYFGTKFLNLKAAHQILEKLSDLVSPIPTLSIFIYLQIFVTIFLTKRLINGDLERNKENIMSVLSTGNLLLFIIFVNGIYLMYTSEKTLLNLGVFGWALFLFSFLFLLYTGKNLYKMGMEAFGLLTKNEPEEEEEESIPEEKYNKYDWVKDYYHYDMRNRQGHPLTEDVVGPMYRHYRFMIGQYLMTLISTVNSTFEIEQSKLISKQIYDTGNRDYFVMIDAPPKIKSKHDYDTVFPTLSFSNDYVQINNAFIALKLNTGQLNNPAALMKIGEEILPSQKLLAIKQATFQPDPKRRYSEDSDEYKEMMADNPRPYPVFQSIGISKLGDSYYVVFNYSKWYRRLVIFPSLKTLKTVLEDIEDEGNMNPFSEFNPMIYFGEKATGGLVGLTAGKAKHIIFGGESGSGKSVWLNSILYQILKRSSPETVKLVLIDPLRVSFQKLKKLKNLAFPIAMDLESTNESINFLFNSQDERYRFLERLGYEDIYAYNKDIQKGIVRIKNELGIQDEYSLPGYGRPNEVTDLQINKFSTRNCIVGKMIPQLIMIYDEFNKFNGEKLYEKNESVTKLIKMGNEARKAGIILCLGTQKIQADTVPSDLRENLTTKIALTVQSKQNSRAILGDGPDNNDQASTLSGYGDMLVYNKTELNAATAIRAQGFFVSDQEMSDLIIELVEMFGMNDFLYKEGEVDMYSWIKLFYSLTQQALESGREIPQKLLDENNQKAYTTGFSFAEQLPKIIDTLNIFFKNNRDQLLDKVALEDNKKNIVVDSPIFQTEQEMFERFETLNYNNQFFTTTKSYIRIKLNTEYLANPKKLEELENIMNLQLNQLKTEVRYNPIKPYKEDSDEYKRMMNMNGNIPYLLLDKYSIVKDKQGYYVQIGYIGDYKKNVIFPQSKSIRVQFTEKYGDRIADLNNGKMISMFKIAKS